eukprot:9583060-Ditylum_brightwellii.AAC.1
MAANRDKRRLMFRNNVAFTDCDAKSCYDRVIPIVLALSQIQAGLPVKTAQFFLGALNQLKYHMVTGYGPTKKVNHINKRNTNLRNRTRRNRCTAKLDTSS